MAVQPYVPLSLLLRKGKIRALSWVIFRGGTLPSFSHRYCWGLWKVHKRRGQGAKGKQK